MCAQSIAKRTQKLEELSEADGAAKVSSVCMNLNTLSVVGCVVLQAELQAAKQALDKQKAIVREKNKELQKCEQERKRKEKEKVECSLQIKEVDHNITRFHKDSRDAAQKVRVQVWLRVISIKGPGLVKGHHHQNLFWLMEPRAYSSMHNFILFRLKQCYPSMSG